MYATYVAVGTSSLFVGFISVDIAQIYDVANVYLMK